MSTITHDAEHQPRYGMVIDIDRCTGCGNCTVACAIENNVAPAPPDTTERTGITWLRVFEADNGRQFPETRSAFFPMMCQQCEHTPCESVCPQKAVEYDEQTGIVGQIPVRCLGCRYCMAACPYHARYFNWSDPAWPEGMENVLNPAVSTRMRGVVEKCNFCHQHLQAARMKAVAEGRETIQDQDYQPACVEACPTQAIIFGNLRDESSAVVQARKQPGTFRLLEKFGTDPKVHYHSKKEWVREMATTGIVPAGNEEAHG